MQKLILEIPENKFQFIMELLSNFEYVKIAESKPHKISSKQKEFVDD
jgi:hypothetical protein